MNNKIFMCGPATDNGGVANHTSNLSLNLRNLGVEIIKHDFSGLHIIKFYNRTFGLLLKSVAERNRYDIIHIQFSAGLASVISAMIGVMVSKLLAKKLVFTYHNSKILYKYLNGICFNNADKIITVSNAQKQLILSSYDISEEVITTIPNGYDSKKFQYRDATECRIRLGLPIDKKIIINIGNLLPVKGHIYLIRAIQTITKMDNSIICIIIGDGYIKKELSRLIDNLKLQNKVYLKGHIPHDEIPSWISASDVFVLSSLNEGNPTVLFESIGCGIPFIGTAVGGIPEIIKSPHIGDLAEPGDVQGLADIIMVALNKHYDKNIILETAKKYSWENISMSTFLLDREMMHDKNI